MGKYLRNTGLTLIAAWAILLLVMEYNGIERPPQMPTLLGVGLALAAGGFALAILGRAGRAVRRTRCTRCRRPIEAGEVYCREHFHQAIDRINDGQEWNT